AGILKPDSVLALGVAPDNRAERGDDPGGAIAEVARGLGVPWQAIPPGGTFAERNRALAALGLDLLAGRGVERVAGSLLTPQVVMEARLPGRMEICSYEGVPVLLDGAHVPASVQGVVEQRLGFGMPETKPQVVLALGQDKDAPGILKALQGVADRIHCTSVEGSLHKSGVELADLVRGLGLGAEVHIQPEEAFRAAVCGAGVNGWVLVVGSLHLVGALRPLACRSTGESQHHD
ncbi:MAG: hypothetical protein KDB61_08080, partial [Planctomycetes bacterium]|nr:hypothetical protein [Planctomycetota bacterium]